jgi:hypothetical protein
MKKKYFILLLVTAIIFSFQTALAADRMDYTNEASKLNAMGLFNGTQNGYELDRVPTRVESAAMLVRLLGAEQEANEKKYEHPFTDVPEWADNIVGYMYEKGYTKGLGNNLFGSSQTTIARDYTTFMLRSLGYGDGDFSYLEAMNYAVTKGIISEEEAGILNSVEFRRNEMAMISYRTLKVSVKGESILLSEKLVEKGVVSAQAAYDAGVADFEVLPVRVYRSNGSLKIDYYYNQLSPEIKEVYYKRAYGTNGNEDFSNDEYMARSAIVLDSQKSNIRNEGYENQVGEAYYQDMTTIVRFYDDSFIMNYYCIVPENINEGEHKYVIIEVPENLKNLQSESEKEFLQYRAEKLSKISQIPTKAYSVEQIDGEYYVNIDRTKLPISMKNAVYYGQSGTSDNDYTDDIERTLRKFFSSDTAHRINDEFIDGEPFKIIYDGYVMFTLLDENEDIVGVTILEIE